MRSSDYRPLYRNRSHNQALERKRAASGYELLKANDE
jgi:hypothetical protein